MTVEYLFLLLCLLEYHYLYIHVYCECTVHVRGICALDTLISKGHNYDY